MKSKDVHILGDLEQSVMDYMWSCKNASVRDVMYEVKKERKAAYTTVMTVMDRLYKKKLLKRKSKGNAYMYSAATTKDSFYKNTAGDMMKSLLMQCGDVAIAQFVNAVDEISPEKLQELKDLLEKKDA